MFSRIHTSFFIAAILAVTSALHTDRAYAQTDTGKTTSAATQPVAPVVAYVDGEVRKVDRDNRKITIKHGEIKNLDMPAMTMVFVAKDAAMLGALRPGDKIRFTAESNKGTLTVTDIQTVK